MTRVFITGSAGFIGFHLARLLLEEGWQVHGFDGFTDYYDVTLKRRRQAILEEHPNFSATEAMLEDGAALMAAAEAFQPDAIVHLAAQAGVRYSLENPRAFVDTNIGGTFNVLETARHLKAGHLLLASSSSVYGAEDDMPFRETAKADTQLTIYGATKKAGESMSHAYAHLHGLPVTAFRFFTVYGSWGRPDLAYFKFTRQILEGRPIDIYNRGDMYRDFTYVGDLVRAVRLLIDAVPQRPAAGREVPSWDSLSPVAPWRVVNIGNGESVRLLDLIETIEDSLGVKAKRNLMEMQPGDVPATWADTGLLRRLTGYTPKTSLREGLADFVSWYRSYYGA